MIKATLPIQTKTLDEDGKVKVEKREIKVNIDTSIFAEQRWEAQFPFNAQKETLFAYVERLQAMSKGGSVSLLSALKAIYCFIKSDEIKDFEDFCQLFDMSDKEYFSNLIDKVQEIFSYALTSGTTNSKN